MSNEVYEGLVFGKWIVDSISYDPGEDDYVHWNIRCANCGRITQMWAMDIKKGRQFPCRCRRHDYGYSVPVSKSDWQSRLYRIWRGMRRRCEVPDNDAAKYYYDKGIRVCEAWRIDFHVFRDWAYANGYRNNLTIDRIDNNKGYSPDNCRWVTMKEQIGNRTNSVKSKRK